MGRAERLGFMAEIERLRGSKVISYVTSDRPNAAAKMMKDILPIFINHLRTDGMHQKVDIFLFTHGGDTLTGFGLARLIREYASSVGVIIPDICHSAGTLFALGANEILMTRGATLSPIDPSIEGPLNPAVQMNPQVPPSLVPLSVESVAGFQALISKEWRTDPAPLLKILAEKVHPLALGDVYRIRQQIEMLALRLLEQHRTDSKNIRNIIHTLSKGLGSHDYLIYLTEAKELLGNQVIQLAPELETLVWNLYTDYQKEMLLGVPYDAGVAFSIARGNGIAVGATAVLPAQVELQFAVIESLSACDVAIQRRAISEQLIQVLPGMPPMPQYIERVVGAGWERRN